MSILVHSVKICSINQPNPIIQLSKAEDVPIGASYSSGGRAGGGPPETGHWREEGGGGSTNVCQSGGARQGGERGGEGVRELGGSKHLSFKTVIYIS